MSWAHDMARLFHERDNPRAATWAAGRVLSPIRGDGGTLTGELVVDGFGLMLRADRLDVPEGVTLEAGQTVALIGNPFTNESGAQKILVVAPKSDREIDETLLDWEV